MHGTKQTNQIEFYSQHCSALFLFSLFHNQKNSYLKKLSGNWWKHSFWKEIFFLEYIETTAALLQEYYFQATIVIAASQFCRNSPFNFVSLHSLRFLASALSPAVSHFLIFLSVDSEAWDYCIDRPQWADRQPYPAGRIFGSATQMDQIIYGLILSRSWLWKNRFQWLLKHFYPRKSI